MPQHFVQLKGVGRVDRIDDHRFSLDVGQRLDLGLYQEVVEAVVAANHHRNIDIGLLLQSKRIVDTRMCDLVASFGESVEHERAVLIGARVFHQRAAAQQHDSGAGDARVERVDDSA